MALTFEQRVAAHEQWHGETLDPWMKNIGDRVDQREQADISLLQHIQELQADVAALKARPTGGGIKRGDTVKIKIL